VQQGDEESEALCEGGQPYRFWGGSEIINPFGQPLVRAALYEEDKISATLSRDLLRRKKILLPYLRNDDPYFTHRALGQILYGRPDPP
jgi:predicted amidohydrolase